MNEVPTRNDILVATSDRGLLGYLFDVATTHSLHQESEFLTTIAGLAKSGERNLYTDGDSGFLNSMNQLEFFRGLSLACELIPLLDRNLPAAGRQGVELSAGLQNEGTDGVTTDVWFKGFRGVFNTGAAGREQPVRGGSSVSHQRVDWVAVREGDTRLKTGGGAKGVDGGEQVALQGRGFDTGTVARPALGVRRQGLRGVLNRSRAAATSGNEEVKGGPLC